MTCKMWSLITNITNINITRAIVLAAPSARSKYTHYLTQKKEQQEKRNKTRNERQKLMQYENLRTNVNA